MLHHLQVVYDGLVMLLGPATLQIEAPGKVDALRKKLRGGAAHVQRGDRC